MMIEDDQQSQAAVFVRSRITRYGCAGVMRKGNACNNNGAVEDLDTADLMRLNDAILNGRAEFIFIPGSVGRLMRASRHFPWLPARPTSCSGPLRTWLKTDTKTVYWHYHFSVYGKFEQEKQKQLAAIAQLRKS